MNREINDLPEINRRIKNIINDRYNGNVRKFSLQMGLSDSSKINRLFNLDKRTDSYPLPSTDIVLLICNTFGYSSDWLLMGKEDDKTVNNIEINKRNVKGNNNVIVGDNNNGTNINDNSNVMDIVKMQQEQINTLLKILATK